MPWSGGGVYTRTNGVYTGATLWQQTEAGGDGILSAQQDVNDQDIATGLNNCVTKDGQSKMAANFVPNANAAYSLGTSSVKWTLAHLSAGVVLYNGSNSVTLQPASLTGIRTVNFPDASGDMVVDTATQTLTGKTFGPIGTSAGDGGRVLLAELAANGTNVVGFVAPDSIASDMLWTLPAADGSANQVLLTNGAGILSFGSASAAGALLIANDLSDVADAATSRTNLGLGNVATQNVGGGLQNASTTLQSALVKNNQAMPYTVVAADRGKTIDATTSGTLSLTAAATLGDGWWCIVANSTSTADVTIDPSGAEKINNAATLVLGGSRALVLVCDGVQFFAVGQPQPAALVQSVYSEDGAVATGSTVMPDDDTIPQNTEGDQYMSVAITPTNSNNVLEIEATLLLSNSLGNAVIGTALFQDATAGALAAVQSFGSNSAAEMVIVTLRHRMAAGTTSATTFKIRAGAASGTTTFNGRSGARKYGGVAASIITVKEFLP